MVEYSGTSTNHAWNYYSIDGIIQCFNFLTYKIGITTKKMGVKNDLQKCRKMGLYDIYIGVFNKIFIFFNMK